MPNTKREYDNSERFKDLGYAIAYYRKRQGFPRTSWPKRWASAASTWGLWRHPT